ncbi:MAG TPA: ATP-dependent Clp protease adaptor ClpS [Flavobacterium sp.]
MDIKEKISEKKSVKEAISLNNEIIIFNDDVNTIDHVIETLMSVCSHTSEQAEQCALIIHYTGKCGVKTGSIKELVPQCTKLLEAGLSAEII